MPSSGWDLLVGLAGVSVSALFVSPMTHTILVLQNDPLSPLGVLEPVFREQGIALDTRYPMEDADSVPSDASGYAGIVVLGGAMSALDDTSYPGISRIISLLRSGHWKNVPILGICLGGQILARAFGGVVHRNACAEVGVTRLEPTPNCKDDPLLSGIEPLAAMEMHFDRFDAPPGSVELVSSPDCPHQAFRIGSTVWGLQFHPEVTPEIVGGWIEHLDGIGGDDNRCHARRLRNDLDDRLTVSMDVGRMIARRWSAIVTAQSGAEIGSNDTDSRTEAENAGV